MMHKLQQLSKSAAYGLFILFAAAVAVAQPTTAAAQGAFNLSITPPTAYLRVRPGTSATHIITLANTGDQAITIKPKFVDFTPNSGAVIPQESLTFPYFELPSQGFQSLKLEPGQKSQLSIKITPPTDAAEGEHYVTVLFESTSVDQDSLASSIMPSVGSNLIILIAQKNQELPLQIKNYGLAKILDSFRPIKLKPQIFNPGIQATVASGSATLSNWRGQTVYTARIFPDVILSKETRQLRATTPTLNQDLTTEEFLPAEFVYSPHLILGPYKLSYTLMDSQGITQTHTTLVYGIPLSAVFVGLLVGLTQLGWILIKQKK